MLFAYGSLGLPRILAIIFGMANWPQEAIQRLSAAVKAQRARRGLTQIQVWEAGGPANSTQTAIEAAEQSTISPATLRKLDHGLGWPDGTALSMLRGDDEAAPVDLSVVSNAALIDELRVRLLGIPLDQPERDHLPRLASQLEPSEIVRGNGGVDDTNDGHQERG